MAAEVPAVAMARTTWSGPTPMGKERKARKARKANGKAQNPTMVTPSRKVLAMTVAVSVTLHANVRRRKKQAMQVPVVDVVYIA